MTFVRCYRFRHGSLQIYFRRRKRGPLSKPKKITAMRQSVSGVEPDATGQISAKKIGRIKRRRKIAGHSGRTIEGKMLTFTIFIAAIEAVSFCRAAVDTIDNGVVNDPDIECGADSINVNFNTKNPFEGKVYIKGHADDPGCRVGPENALSHNSTSMKTFGISVPFVKCGVGRKRSLNPVGISVSTVVVITFHPLFLTKIDRAYEIRCFYMAADKTVSVDLGVSDLTTGLVTSNLPMPVCRYEVLDSINGKPVKFANIGDVVYHKWTCDTQTTDIFCVLIHSCFVDDGKGSNRAVLLDENGCAQDRYLLQNLDYATDLQAGQEAQVFKYADRPQLFFQCQISILLKDGSVCNRPKCKAPEKGRKKRDTSEIDDRIFASERDDRPTVDVATEPINVFDIDDVVDEPNGRLPTPPRWQSYASDFSARKQQKNRVSYQSRLYKVDNDRHYSVRYINSNNDEPVCMSSLAFTAVVATTVLICILTIIVTATLLRRKRKAPIFYPPPPLVENVYGYHHGP